MTIDFLLDKDTLVFMTFMAGVFSLIGVILVIADLIGDKDPKNWYKGRNRTLYCTFAILACTANLITNPHWVWIIGLIIAGILVFYLVYESRDAATTQLNTMA